MHGLFPSCSITKFWSTVASDSCYWQERNLMWSAAVAHHSDACSEVLFCSEWLLEWFTKPEADQSVSEIKTSTMWKDIESTDKQSKVKRIEINLICQNHLFTIIHSNDVNFFFSFQFVQQVCMRQVIWTNVASSNYTNGILAAVRFPQTYWALFLLSWFDWDINFLSFWEKLFDYFSDHPFTYKLSSYQSLKSTVSS